MRIKLSLGDVITVLLAFVVAAPVAFLGSWLLGPVFYQVRMSTVELGPGSVGTVALENTPVATSIADMEQMDTFTLDVRRQTMSLKPNRTVKLGDITYYTIDLPSGESVAARINFKATTALPESDGILEPDTRLPIGRWVKWKQSGSDRKKIKTYYNLTYTDSTHYVDMRGDAAAPPTRASVQVWIFFILLVVGLCFSDPIVKRYMVKKGYLKE